MRPRAVLRPQNAGYGFGLLEFKLCRMTTKQLGGFRLQLNLQVQLFIDIDIFALF